MSESYRQTRNYENLNRCIYPGVGEFGIPELEPVHCDAETWIGFNYAKGCDVEDRPAHSVHFFIDDYQFNRLWTAPDVYLPMLSGFRCVATPDFSMYTDFPKTIQIYNHYRKHWLGRYWQDHGITVIPTIAWSTPDSYEWCFDGEPVGGDVIVSSVGTQTSWKTKKLFMRGYLEMEKRLKPHRVFFYGDIPPSLAWRVNIYPVRAFQHELKERMKLKKAAENAVLFENRKE